MSSNNSKKKVAKIIIDKQRHLFKCKRNERFEIELKHEKNFLLS